MDYKDQGSSDMIVFENGQRASKCNLRRMNYSESQTDITFKFVSQPEVSLTAHKYILGMRSRVFEAMFFGPLATKHTQILLEEENVDAFRVLIQFIYGLEPQISPETVTDVLHLAEKYWVPDASNRCVCYLTDALGGDTVCQTFELANMYCLYGLKHSCKTWMKQHLEDFIHSDDFVELSHDSFQELLTEEEIRNDVLLLATACNRWAIVRCEERGTEPTIDNIRLCLAEVCPDPHAKALNETSCSDNAMASSGYVSECFRLIPYVSSQCKSKVTHFSRDLFELSPSFLDVQSVDLELMADTTVSVSIAHFDTSTEMIQSIIVSRKSPRDSVIGDKPGSLSRPTCSTVNSWTSSDRCIIFNEPVCCKAYENVTITFRLRSNSAISESSRIKKRARVLDANMNFETVPSNLLSVSIHRVE